MRIPTAHIEPELKAIERYDAIRELLRRLVHAGALLITAEPEIFAAFSEREKVMSTGVGFRLGFPHITSDEVSEPVVAFGRSQAGIEFDSLDDKPVEFIFLFILPTNGFPSHERARFMGRIGHALGNRHAQTMMRECLTAREIADALERAFNDGPAA
ncbi:MAG: ptsN 1 [Chthoniobacteraceae bacterium]|nr:ptsN 1 [Chthoniobacteraceae bacterium]